MKKSLLFIASIFVYYISFAQLPSYVPQNGLKAWWSFNGNANDLSGNGNHGNVNGASLSTDRFGTLGSAYYFNGINSWITIPNNPTLYLPTNMTITLWVQSTATHPVSAGLVSKWNVNGGVGTGQEQYAVWAGQDGLTFGTMTSSNFKVVYEYNSMYNNGNWHFYAFVWNNNTMSIWRDGGANLVGIEPQDGYITNYNQDLEIGRTDGGNGVGRYFNGQLDDIGIWNRALTYQEILDLYFLPTGIDNISSMGAIKVYPNPVKDNITFSLPKDDYSIEIIDITGRAVLQATIKNDVPQVNVAGLNKGIYLAKILDYENNLYSVRFVINY